MDNLVSSSESPEAAIADYAVTGTLETLSVASSAESFCLESTCDAGTSANS